MGAKKLGRPTDNPKNITMKIRFDQDTFDKLEECSKVINVSRAEVVRRGVQKMHEGLPEK